MRKARLVRRAAGTAGNRAAVLVVVVGAFLGTGCDDATATSSAPPELPGVVGPAPLRRLSNSEYTNALADLFPDVHVDAPPLPNDTLVAGFENAAEAQKPSDVRIARYEAIADLYAREATRGTARTRSLVGCAWDTPSTADACAATFVTTWGERLFRRPLLAAERERFVARFQRWSTAIDFEAAVRLVLAAMLQSPQFLYRVEPEPAGEAGAIVALDGFAIASRLSFLLWESVPDAPLLDDARTGRLTTASAVRERARRMLDDPRARRTYWSFHRQWLGLGRVLEEEHMARTDEVDAAWTPATARAAELESRLFVENVLAGGGTFGDLFTSRKAWLDAETARIYGVPTPSAKGPFEVALPESERAGILTRAAFLAGTSHRGSTSPPIRGNAVQLRMLCQVETPPPPNVDLSVPTIDPGDAPKTTRGLFEARTSPASCQSCHRSLNGFGFGFERYSASGAHRTHERGLAIDARGTVLYTDVDGDFDGPVALSFRLAKSRAVKRCATLQWMRYAMGRAPADDEIVLVDALTDRLVAGDDVRALLVDLVGTNGFRMRKVASRRAP